MKKSALIALFISASYFVASAQNPVLSTTELQAPANVQQQLLSTRKIIADKKLTFSVGLTSVSGKALKQLAGEKQLNASEEAQFSQSVQSHIRAINTTLKINIVGQSAAGEGAATFGNASQRRFDLRTTGNSTPIKDQNPYGTCWAFGAVSAYESNYRVTNTQTIDASEQQVINCSGAGDENGGLALEVIKWMVNNNRNLVNENSATYRGPKTSCGAYPATPYYAQAYGVIDPSGDPSRIASVAAIKQALVRYGAISASVQATDAFQNYTSGVFNEFASNLNSPATNHAIALIGWDDDKQAWILKNSWGTGWGTTCDYGSERGYMYIGYNTNNIGRRAAWILARQTPGVGTGKIVWRNTNGSISLWSVDNNGNSVNYKEHGPFAGWTVVNYANNKILWRNNDGRISLWNVDDNGNQLSYKEHGPYPGWTVVNYADNKILWRNNDGRISIWTIDNNGNSLGFKEHGPYPGWTVVNYDKNRILWRNNDGRISLWNIDNNGNSLGYKEHGPYPGWTVANYADNKILWRHADGRISLWSVDNNGNSIGYKEHGPYAGWTAQNYANNRILWCNVNGRISLWNVDNNNNIISYKEHGPFAGWTAVNYQK